MSMVMFATLCDNCGKRSDEYGDLDVYAVIAAKMFAPDCAAPGTKQEGVEYDNCDTVAVKDGDTVICKACFGVQA